MSAKGWSLFFRKDKKQYVCTYATVTGPKQKLIPKAIKTEAEARKWARSFLEANNQRPAEVLEQRRAVGPTFGELAPQWYAHRDRVCALGDIAPSTCADNKTHIELWLLAAKVKVDGRLVEMRDMPIAALDVPIAIEWLLGVR